MLNDLERLQYYLFVTEDIPLTDNLNQINIYIHFRFTAPGLFQWAAGYLDHWCGTEINTQPIRELVHQLFYRETNETYKDLLISNQEDWQHLCHLMDRQIPVFLPYHVVHSTHGRRTIVAPNGKHGIPKTMYI